MSKTLNRKKPLSAVDDYNLGFLVKYIIDTTQRYDDALLIYKYISISEPGRLAN